MSFEDDMRRKGKNLLFGIVAATTMFGYSGKGPLSKLAEFKKYKSLFTINIENKRTVEFNENGALIFRGEQVNGILPGTKITNPTPTQEFLQKTLELCAQSPMMQHAIETLKEHKIPILEDKTQGKVSMGYYHIGNKYIGILNTEGVPQSSNVLTMVEEILHAYDFLEHSLDHKKEGKVFTPEGDVLRKLNLEVSAKARRISACYEIGGELWEYLKEDPSFGRHAKQYEKSIKGGADNIQSIAEAYFNIRGNMFSNLRKSCVNITMRLYSTDSLEFSPEHAIQYYKKMGVEPSDMKEITNDILIRAGYIPGEDKNFLAGFKDLTAPEICVFETENYEKIQAVNNVLGIKDTYIEIGGGVAVPLSLVKHAQDNIRDQYNANIALYDSIKEKLPELKEENRAFYDEYDIACVSGPASKELEEKYSEVVLKAVFYNRIETGKAYRQLEEEFNQGRTLSDITPAGSKIVDGVGDILSEGQSFDKHFDRSLVDAETGFVGKIKQAMNISH